MKVTAATQNAHKMIEIEAITKDFDMELVTMKDAGLANVEIEENGSTFEENSFIKASEVSRLTGGPAIADDSGLCVDALGGAPGIYSARFGGEHGNDAANRKRLLRELEGVPEEKRTASFHCVITLVYTDGSKLVAEGICPGSIATSERGDHGFGYDSLFIPKGYGQTFAELSTDVKNSIGHRALALKKLKELLEQKQK